MNVIVFTDLDGTFLDHSSYSCEAAKPALEELRKRGIPVVFVTSKTRMEVEVLLRQLNLREPFITENGGGVYFPLGYRDYKFVNANITNRYAIYELGTQYERVREFFDILKREYGIEGMGDMTPDAISRFTDLPPNRAVMAKEREFTEAFRFLDATAETRLTSLKKRAEAAGFAVTQGGRFYHLVGKNQSKGKAIGVVESVFTDNARTNFTTIALGDSLNDLPMLRVVDIPYVVMKPDGSFIDAPVAGIRKTKHPGPEGWNDAILSCLEELEEKESAQD